jgi:hypothetical protein
VELLLLLFFHLGKAGVLQFYKLLSPLYHPRALYPPPSLPSHLHYPTNPANTLRRRHAHNHKPNPLAHNRRCHRPTTRLVPRPRNCLLLHEHGLRHQRSRQRTTQHVLPHGARLPNRRPLQEPIPRHILPASSPTTERNPYTECGRQCHNPGGRDCHSWCCVVFRESILSKFR